MAMATGIWAIIVGLIGLNGFAAGAATVAHLWKPRQNRGGKIIFSAMLAGLLPATLVLPNMLRDGLSPPYLIGVLTVFAAVMAASLPGAVIVTRKLEASRGEYRTFE